MNLDKVRARPFLLLMISDGVEGGFITQPQLATIESQLVDMSLKIAKNFYSPVIGHDLKKSCSIVLGVATLGLLELSGGDSLAARKILSDDSVIICFRKGWESVNTLFKAHGAQADRATLLNHYQYNDNEHKDIASIHESLLAEQHDVLLLNDIAAIFESPLSVMDADIRAYSQDEKSIKADVQLSIFEALMKRHAIGHTQYDDLKALLTSYREKPDVFSSEFSEVTETVLAKLDANASRRIEGWLPSIADELRSAFELLAFENSGAEIYISIFDEILQGNINATHFMHAYESLLEPEKQLHTSLKMQGEADVDFANLSMAEDAEFADDIEDLSEYGVSSASDY